MFLFFSFIFLHPSSIHVKLFRNRAQLSIWGIYDYEEMYVILIFPSYPPMNQHKTNWHIFLMGYENHFYEKSLSDYSYGCN